MRDHGSHAPVPTRALDHHEIPPRGATTGKTTLTFAPPGAWVKVSVVLPVGYTRKAHRSGHETAPTLSAESHLAGKRPHGITSTPTNSGATPSNCTSPPVTR